MTHSAPCTGLGSDQKAMLNCCSLLAATSRAVLGSRAVNIKVHDEGEDRSSVHLTTAHLSFQSLRDAPAPRAECLGCLPLLCLLLTGARVDAPYLSMSRAALHLTLSTRSAVEDAQLHGSFGSNERSYNSECSSTMVAEEYRRSSLGKESHVAIGFGERDALPSQ